MTDEQLMVKHSLSAKGLQSLKSKLLAAGLLTQDQLDGKAPTTVTPQVDKKAFARNIADAVKSGLPDNEITRKFGISSAKLTGVYNSLIKAGYLMLDDLIKRPGNFEETVDLAPEIVKFPEQAVQSPDNKEPKTDRPVFRWVCPACKTPHGEEYPVCPQCGIIVEKFLAKAGAAIVEHQESSREETVSPSRESATVADVKKKLKGSGDHVINTAKELRDKVGRSSVFERIINFIKVPRNAATIGGVGIVACLVMITNTYFLQPKLEQKRQLKEAATIAFTETIRNSSMIRPDLKLMKNLIDQGADVNTTVVVKEETGERTTALIALSLIGASDIVQLLLENGANPNLQTPIGNANETVSPLMAASFAGHAGVVMILLKAGADPNATSGASGRTVLDHALRKNKPEIVQILKAHGAKEGPKK